MLLSDLLILSNDELYEVYVTAVKNKNLPMINTIRSIIADRFSLKALEQSPIDSWRDNKAITRFFMVKL